MSAYEAALNELRPGRTVYVPGASGELPAFCDALAEDPERAAGIHFLSCLLPGINEFDCAGLHPTARLTTFLLPSSLQASFEAGRVRVLPLSYLQIARYVATEARIDVAIAHVSSPGPTGRCSFGISADFTPLAWNRALRRVAIVNSAMPMMRRGPTIALSEADVVVSADAPVLITAGAEPSPEVRRVASSVASLVDDGAAVQIGIGNVPSAVWGELGRHHDLVVRSGIVGDEIEALAARGVLSRGSSHRTGVAYGSARLYRFLVDSDLLEFASVPVTHGAASDPGMKLTAINSALEVDLLGQVNLEWRGRRLSSGVGGAPDFIRAAFVSGGRSVIALPATTRGGSVSRIVARLNVPTVSLPAWCADTVVTEHGIAQLRGRSLEERAAAMIGVAAPSHRAALAEAWRSVRPGAI